MAFGEDRHGGGVVAAEAEALAEQRPVGLWAVSGVEPELRGGPEVPDHPVGDAELTTCQGGTGRQAR
ncbi:hypothetical protein ACFWY6_41110 [Streptomyces sp. NPDC059037]|uniref:hypothetical protein n=1 Tax=Streptomyces sp. NPDC059037 TaxID=3346710 RepID=UPI00368895F6